jgi:hypothetical protein
MVANLRAENALLRNKYQSKMAEQNDVLEEKHTQQVNHLMNIKYEIEELVGTLALGCNMDAGWGE